MAAKTTEWRPGPTVCRCCLSEGCYKDISTEYFWMGKREVYADMLSETFDLSISYSQSGGPNSHSRLICEPCISRLRDAADFKRQVQECERTFTTYLDPGNSIADMAVSVEVDRTESDIKVECVKEEKVESEDDDFDDRPDFGDDDDYDDLDDQPLTKLASKIPKKESVEILELLNNDKVTEKRKSSTKSKSSSAKKVKTKKEIATSSKEKPEKKKKGTEAIRTPKSSIQIEWSKKRPLLENKANSAVILGCSNAIVFRWSRGKFLCAYCPEIFRNVAEIRKHCDIHEKLSVLHKSEVHNSFPLKVDITDLKCTLCNNSFINITDLKVHLVDVHEKIFDSNFDDGVIPFVLTGTEYRCVICDNMFESYVNLFSHMNEHYQSFVCYTCGKGYSAKYKLRAHQKCHETGKVPCSRCDLVFLNHAIKNRHVATVHGSKKRYRCPICAITFESCHSRLIHLGKVHGQKKRISM